MSESPEDRRKRLFLRRALIVRRARVVAAKRERWVEAQAKYVDNRDGSIVVEPEKVGEE